MQQINYSNELPNWNNKYSWIINTLDERIMKQLIQWKQIMSLILHIEYKSNFTKTIKLQPFRQSPKTGPSNF